MEVKRYRVMPFFDFDTRVHSLTQTIEEHWEERIKEQHRQNRENVLQSLKREYGEHDAEAKVKNFTDLGPKPMSVLAFHNRFFAQVRGAFVMGAYFPALTGACALGERILNHLVLLLRDDYKPTPQYKKVYKKSSFDDWEMAIATLAAWDVLLPKAAGDFRALMGFRHRAIHFRPEVDQNARPLALQAVQCLQGIIGEQFAGLGSPPWFIRTVPGEIYLKKEWEQRPFVKKVYMPNGVLVGPRHHIESMHPRVEIVDPDLSVELPEVSDDEFADLRRQFNKGGQKS